MVLPLLLLVERDSDSGLSLPFPLRANGELTAGALDPRCRG